MAGGEDSADPTRPSGQPSATVNMNGSGSGDCELPDGNTPDAIGKSINIADQDIAGSDPGTSKHEAPIDTQEGGSSTCVPEAGDVAEPTQSREEPVNSSADLSDNSLRGTDDSSDPAKAGVIANDSTDESQDGDTGKLATGLPESLPPCEDSKAETKGGVQEGPLDDEQQKEPQQISPPAAGSSKDELPRYIKREGANIGDAVQGTEKPVKGDAESSSSLQETKGSSDQQWQQDLNESGRNPVSEDGPARADPNLHSNEGGNHLPLLVQLRTGQAQLTDLEAKLKEQKGINFKQGLEIRKLQNDSRDLQTNFHSKLNEEVELLCRQYSAECHQRLEEQRAEFMTKEKEMDLQMQRVQEEKEKLLEQILHLEKQHAANSSQGGSYLDDSKAATPALLSAAVSTVRDTGRKFTKEFIDQLKKQPANIRSEVEGRILENFDVAILQGTHKKFQYQAYMNWKLFDGFENRTFSILLDNIDEPPGDFLSMEQAELYRKESFRQFQKYDLRKFPVKTLVENAKHDPFLKEFCFLKFQAIFDELTENQLFGHHEHSDCILEKKMHPNTAFYMSFCKFAVSVWLVHRLAFAFKTPATTFIAEEGVPFDCHKMESAGPADDITPDSRVGFVVLPGFQVSQSTIPCEVYLVEKKQDTPVLDGQVTDPLISKPCHENSSAGN